MFLYNKHYSERQEIKPQIGDVIKYTHTYTEKNLEDIRYFFVIGIMYKDSDSPIYNIVELGKSYSDTWVVCRETPSETWQISQRGKRE